MSLCLKKICFILVVLFAGIAALFDPFSGFADNKAAAFTLYSSDIIDGETLSEKHVYNGFGCTGQNISPALSWDKVPAGTKSFALTVHDPDAPTGSGWWHWITFNIPASITELPQGAGSHIHDIHPNIMQGVNDYGSNTFGGACPPKGDQPHRYIFTVHALSVPYLEIPENASAALIGYNINANTIAQSKIVPTYGR